MAILADCKVTRVSGRKRVFRRCAYLVVAVCATLSLSIFGSSGCNEGDAYPPPSDAPSDSAGLRLFLEIDYMHEMLGNTLDQLTILQNELFQGHQSSDDCTYLYSITEKKMEVKPQPHEELYWLSPLPTEAGIDNYQDTEAQFLAITDMLGEHRSFSIDEPSLYMVICDYFVSPDVTSKDPSRPNQKWRWDDKFLPDFANTLGFSYFPGAPFAQHVTDPFPLHYCDTRLYGSTWPVAVIFVEEAKKGVREINEVLKRLPGGIPSGCQSTTLINENRFLARVLGHELLHEIGIPDFYDTDPETQCDDDPTCRCIMNGGHLRRIWEKSDSRITENEVDCQAAQDFVNNTNVLCIGESGNRTHKLEACTYAQLWALNPPWYR